MFSDMILTEIEGRMLSNALESFRHHSLPFTRFPGSKWAMGGSFHLESDVRVFLKYSTGRCLDEKVASVWSKVESVPMNVVVSH